MELYLVYADASRAAVEAGYSERSAKQTGSLLLENPAVQKTLQGAQDASAERTQLTADEVARGLHAIAANSAEPAGARVSAWIALAKHTGAIHDGPNVNKQQVNVTVVRNTPLQLNGGDDGDDDR